MPKSFLKDGAKLKAYVFFKGRSIVYKDKGEILLLKLAQELEEFGKVEQMPRLRRETNDNVHSFQRRKK